MVILSCAIAMFCVYIKGECSEETEEQQMKELTILNPKRIGHGVFLHDKAKSWILGRRIPIEMCLTSAVQAHMISSIDQHPGLKLLREKYPVVICTDDPLVFSTSLTDECLLAVAHLGLSSDDEKTACDFIGKLQQETLAYKFQ